MAPGDFADVMMANAFLNPESELEHKFANSPLTLPEGEHTKSMPTDPRMHFTIA